MPRRLELVSLTKGTDVSSLRDALKLVNFEPPPLAPGKVRVKILFAALNFADLLHKASTKKSPHCLQCWGLKHRESLCSRLWTRFRRAHALLTACS